VPLSHKLGREQIAYLLRDSGATGILADPIEAATSCEAADAAGLSLRLATRAPREGWRNFDAALRAAALDPHVETRHFDEQAFQPYAAGSTGMPEGICLTHGGILWAIEQSEAYWPVSPTERGIIAAPMFHKKATRGVIKPLLRGGGSIVIMPRFEAEGFLRAVSAYGVTGAGGVPAMYAEIARHAPLIRSLDFSALKLLSMGSSAVQVDDRRLLPGDDPEAILAGLRESLALPPPLGMALERGAYMLGCRIEADAPSCG